MPVELVILAVVGLVVAVVAAAVLGGQIGRLVRRRLDARLPWPVGRTREVGKPATRASVASGSPIPFVAPPAPPVAVAIPDVPAMSSPAIALESFPGVAGSRRIAHIPPAVFSIPTSSMSPAARDRARRLAALAASPPAAAAVPTPARRPPGTGRRARRVGIAASGLAAGLIAVVLVAAGAIQPWTRTSRPTTGQEAALGGPEGQGPIALVPTDAPTDLAPSGTPQPTSTRPAGDGTRRGPGGGGTTGGTGTTTAPGSIAGRGPAPHGGTGHDGPPPTARPTRTPAPPTATPPADTPTPPSDTPTPAPETTPTPAPLAVGFSVRASGLTVHLANHTRGAVSWAWSFGDGSTSTARNPPHTYAVGGTYTIRLVATAASGSSAAHSEAVMVSG